MEKKQIYAIAAVLIVLIAAVGVYYFASGDAQDAAEYTDAAGNKIVIPEGNVNDITITAASPSIADILCHMGYASNIVCVSSYCDNPELPNNLLTCGSYTNPDTDAISNADATVTFIDGSNSRAISAYDTLRSAGMNVVLMYGASDTIDGVYKNVEIVGSVMGDNSAANNLVSELKNTVSSLGNATTGSDATSMIIATGFSSLYTDANGNFINLDSFDGSGVYIAGESSAICSMAGNVSSVTCPVEGSSWVAADTDWVSTNTGNVDIIIILWTNMESMPNDAAISALIEKMKDTAWANCGAVNSENIFFIGESIGSNLSRVTPYTVESGLPILSLYINPEAYATSASGGSISWNTLPSCVDDSNASQLIGYTNNKSA